MVRDRSLQLSGIAAGVGWGILLWLIAVPGLAATIAGPPTYTVTNRLDVDRGLGTTPIRAFSEVAVHSSSGSRSTGATEILPPGPPTDTLAQGIASNTQLKSRAQAGGSTGFAQMNIDPTVEAQNTSVITRFFQFSSGQGAPTVSVDPIVLLDGLLVTAVQGGDPYVIATSSVDLSLDIIDPAGNLLAQVFRVHADLAKPSCCFQPGLRTFTTGAADAANWASSWSRLLPGSDTRQVVNYIDVLPNAYQAPVGVPIGFRWTLDTEATIRGQFARSDAAVISDFFNTADLDFDLSSSETGSSFVEILTVPEPQLAALLLVAIAVASQTRRSRRC